MPSPSSWMEKGKTEARYTAGENLQMCGDIGMCCGIFWETGILKTTQNLCEKENAEIKMNYFLENLSPVRDIGRFTKEPIGPG